MRSADSARPRPRPDAGERLAALAGHVLDREPGMLAERLAWACMLSDMEAFARLGAPITGTTWLRGAVHPESRELGDGWFEALVRSRASWPARAAAWALTAWVVLDALGRR